MTNEEIINRLNSIKAYYNDRTEPYYVGFDYKDNEALDLAIKALEQTRPKGTWIGEESLDGSIRYMCDNCKEFEYVDHYNFCPNCGAKMEVEE